MQNVSAAAYGSSSLWGAIHMKQEFFEMMMSIPRIILRDSSGVFSDHGLRSSREILSLTALGAIVETSRSIAAACIRKRRKERLECLFVFLRHE
jgi:hypothetical protein